VWRLKIRQVLPTIAHALIWFFPFISAQALLVEFSEVGAAYKETVAMEGHIDFF
jgi:hypothetical protein